MNNFKETVERLKNLKGNVKGDCTEAIVKYLKEIKKESYLPEIQKKMMTEYGFNEDLEKIKPLNWYPIAFEVALIFSIKEVLDLKDDEIKDLGRNLPKIAFIVRVLMKYFLTLKRGYEEAPNFWKKHYDFGIMENVEFNQEERFLILRIKDFNLHPLYCTFLEGYLETIVKYSVISEKVWVEEVKCSFRQEASFHEFKIKW